MKLRTAVAIALAATFVLGVSAIVVGMRSFVGKRSVLFETGCKGANGRSPSGEPITSCAGTPHTHLVIDGREAGSAGLRALSPGARVVFTVTAGSDDTHSVGCKIILLGYRRTLVERWGGESARCIATIP